MPSISFHLRPIITTAILIFSMSVAAVASEQEHSIEKLAIKKLVINEPKMTAFTSNCVPDSTITAAIIFV
ncbi:MULTISPECIES: hypothetical protein [unclassified Psychrobacter]|uniref:hypothetical protein n=1 Tax=unclassified Psychrobacter TaxID=196806 RepID=UPI0025FDACEB|nr:MULTISPECIES: hypothetical protein [unclassified Psychrobacter]